MTKNLMDALNELNLKLNKESITLNLVICGAFAIELHGFRRSEETQDIDTHTDINDDVQKMIKDISEELGINPRWLNNQVADISLPDGASVRMKSFENWSNISVKYLSIEDLIRMKISAWLNRGHLTDKDYNDLVVMDATKQQIEAGIEYVIKSHDIMNLPPKFKNESLGLLNALRKYFQ